MASSVCRTVGPLLLATTLACGGGGASGTPTGQTRFAYVVNALDKTMTVYSVDRSSGALTVVPPARRILGCMGAVSVVQNRFLYSIGSSWLFVHAIDGTTGALTPVDSTSIASLGVQGLAASPDGLRVFAVKLNSILAFQVGATGALTPIGGTAYATDPYPPYRLATAGPIVFASSTSSNVLALRNTAGVLGAPSVRSVANAVWDFAGSPDGRHAYAADGAGHVTAYTVDLASGALTALTGAHTAAATGGVVGALVHPGGKYLYVANRNGDVTRFDVSAADGTLGATSTVTSAVLSPSLTRNFEHLVTDPVGRFLYLTNNAATPHNVILGFTVDPSTGALTQMPATFTGGGEQMQGMAFVTN